MPSTSKKLKELFDEQKGICPYCKMGMSIEKGYDYSASLDHVVPKSKGGSNCKKNLVAACQKCNFNKGSKLINVPGKGHKFTKRELKIMKKQQQEVIKKSKPQVVNAPRWLRTFSVYTFLPKHVWLYQNYATYQNSYLPPYRTFTIYVGV